MREAIVTFANRQARTLVGDLGIPDGDGPHPAVLVIHGFRGNRGERHIQAVGDALVWSGFVSLRVDLTNNLGDSEGDFADLTVSQELDDADDALNYLMARPEVDPARIGITGHSLGGLVAAIAAARRPEIVCVVTLSAVFDMAPKLQKFLGADQVASWRERGTVEMDPPGSGLLLKSAFYDDLLGLDVTREIANLRAPLRIVQGGADSGVTEEDAGRYREHAGSTVKEVSVVGGADHSYSDDNHLMQVCLLTADWLRRHLMP